jgi:phosphogluconate dehydratase
LTTRKRVQAAFKAGELDRDVIVVVRFQGPRANGMPELHKLTPPLGVLQDKGFKVALVTDGRMSGASGKVPAAIHLTPEALGGGPLALVQDGDVIRTLRLHARGGRRGRARGVRDAGRGGAVRNCSSQPAPLSLSKRRFSLGIRTSGKTVLLQAQGGGALYA